MYVLYQSPQNYFEHSKEQLETLNFKQRGTDSRLFVRCDCICVWYVDGILMFVKTNLIIDDVIKDLRKIGAQIG